MPPYVRKLQVRMDPVPRQKTIMQLRYPDVQGCTLCFMDSSLPHAKSALSRSHLSQLCELEPNDAH